MSDIVITEFMDETPLAALRTRYDVRIEPTLVEDRPALLEAVASAQALIVRNRTRVDAELLKAAPALRAIGRLGVGLDNIDQPACAARSVQVLPATGANDTAVAEYVIAMALTLRRGAYGDSARMAGGEWPRTELIGREVAGAVLGLAGFGGIAREVACRALALGMQIIAHDPNIDDAAECWGKYGVTPVDKTTLLASADVLSLHVPLVPETRHLVDAAALAQMKPNAIVINTARGGVVDDAALADALRAGRLGGAAIDVFEDEPLPADSVYAGLDNAEFGKLILTPHIAGVTLESNTRVSAVTVDNVLKALDEMAA